MLNNLIFTFKCLQNDFKCTNYTFPFKDFLFDFISYLGFTYLLTRSSQKLGGAVVPCTLVAAIGHQASAGHFIHNPGNVEYKLQL